MGKVILLTTDRTARHAWPIRNSITVSEAWCHNMISEAHEYADRETPDWRMRLAGCCLFCSDLPMDVLRRLEQADLAWGLLNIGGSWHDWRVRE
jgi:hypothetical protein